MAVPFIDLGPVTRLVRGNPTVEQAFDQAFYDVLDAHEFVGGPTVARLEVALAEKLGAKHAVTCGSGTDALVLALMAAGIHRGHYVAMPNLTFWATYEAVVRVGATPVLLDIDDSLQLSYDELRVQKRRFDAVILVHLYGWCSPHLQEIRDYCHRQRITLIEDAAQAFGVYTAENESVFRGAHISTLSFYPAKVIGGVGDGGAVLTSSERVAKRVRALANHGRTGHYEHAATGLCSRMSGIEAAYLLRAVAVSDGIVRARRDALARYMHMLAEGGRFKHVGPSIADGNGYLCTVEVAERDRVAAVLKERGIGTAITYPKTIADQRGAEEAIVMGSMVKSRTFCEGVLNLPLFHGITTNQIDEVMATFRETIK